MTRYPLQALIRIRKDREEAAVTRLALARASEEMAVRTLETRRREHREYLEWCAAEADRLMGGLLGREIQRLDVETALAQIGWNKEGEASRLERITAAEAALETARKETMAALAAHRIATSALERIMEHHRDWSHKLRLVEEAHEEAELQEIAELLHQRREARVAA
jgi:hypothetical protein